MPVPVMTPEQRADALAKALAARQERSAALAELTAGKVTIAAVLDDADSPLQQVKVRRVLTALPGIGPVTADKVIADLRIDPRRRVAGLGKNQRAALAERFAA
jgi:transposase